MIDTGRFTIEVWRDGIRTYQDSIEVPIVSWGTNQIIDVTFPPNPKGIRTMSESNEQHGIKDLALSESPTPETPELSDQEVLAEELKANIDYLMIAYKKGDKKRVMFRVGQVSRQFVELGRMCAEFPEAQIVEPNKGIIV